MNETPEKPTRKTKRKSNPRAWLPAGRAEAIILDLLS